MASLGIKVELLLTVAAVVGCGILVNFGWLSKEYAGIGIGLLTGSGIRSVVGSAIPAVAPSPPTVPATLPLMPGGYTSIITKPADPPV